MMRMRLPIAESKFTKHVDAFVIGKISFFHNITKQASHTTRVKAKLPIHNAYSQFFFDNFLNL
jgi:hypothetical protein